MGATRGTRQLDIPDWACDGLIDVRVITEGHVWVWMLEVVSSGHNALVVCPSYTAMKNALKDILLAAAPRRRHNGFESGDVLFDIDVTWRDNCFFIKSNETGAYIQCVPTAVLGSIPGSTDDVLLFNPGAYQSDEIASISYLTTPKTNFAVVI